MNQQTTQGLISLKLQAPYRSLLASGGIALALSILLATSGCESAYQFVTLTVLWIVMVTSWFPLVFPTVQRLDLLLDIHRVVIWETSRTKLAELIRLRALTNYIIILEYTFEKHCFYQILLKDRIGEQHFKQLMRYIKWKQPHANSN